MSEVGSAFVSIIPSFRNFGRKVNQQVTADATRAGREAGDGFSNAMAGSVRKLAGLTAAAFGGVRIAEFFKGSVAAASDFNETVSKTRAVFGTAAPAVEAFTQNASHSLGQTRQAALEASATLGNLFVAMGLGQKPAANMSTRMVQLAGDLSSFNNVPTADALEAIRSGLIGETEPLRQFGVNLSAASIQSEALRVGLVRSVGDTSKATVSRERLALAQSKYTAAVKAHGKTSDEAKRASIAVTVAENSLAKALVGKVPVLTAAQKAQAAYSLILGQTKVAQGDLGRTALGLANQQRELGNSWGGLRQELGAYLLPAVLAFVTALNAKLMPVLHTLVAEHGPQIQAVLTRIGEALVALASGDTGGLGDDFASLAASAKELGPALAQASSALAGDTFKVSAVAMGFLADNVDLLAKALPFLAAGYIAVKAAKVAEVPLTALEIASNLALAATNRKHTKALESHAVALEKDAGATVMNTAANQTGLATQLRVTAATVAQRVATTAIAVATRAAAAAQWLLNAAMTANPIGLVVVAIAALVAGAVLLYQRWTPFRELVNAVGSALKALALTLVGGVVAGFRLLAGVVQGAWSAISAGWAMVQPIFAALFEVISQPIRGVIQYLKGFAQVIVGIFTGDMDKVTTGVSNMIGGVVQFFLGMPARIIAAVLPLIPRLLAFGGQALAALGRAIVTGAVAVFTFFKGLPGRAAGLALALVGRLAQLGSQALRALAGAVTAGAEAVWTFFRGLPGRAVAFLAALPARLTSSGQSAIRGLAAGIVSGAGAVWSFFTGLPGKIMALVAGLGGQLASAGADVARGFARGIASMGGAVLDAAKQLVSKLPAVVKKALDVKSPSRVMAAIGRDTAAGLAKGLDEGNRPVRASAAKMVRGAASAAKKAVPKPVFLELGRSVYASLLEGIQAGGDKARKAVEKVNGAILDEAAKVLRRTDLTKAQRVAVTHARDAALATVSQAWRGRLAPLQAQLASVDAQLTAAQARLGDLTKARADLESSITDKLLTARDALTETIENAVPTPEAIAARLQANLDRIRAFGTALIDLSKRGFSKEIISQIAQQGVAALDTAKALTGATDAQVKEINTTYTAIGKASADTGKKVAGELYDAGIKGAQGLITGLRSRQGAINAEITRIAKGMIATLQRTLKLRSPSRVFMALGEDTMAGYAEGLTAQVRATEHTMQAAMARMADRAAVPVVRPARVPAVTTATAGTDAVSRPTLTGPLIGTAILREPVDVDMLARRLDFALAGGTLGGGGAR